MAKNKRSLFSILPLFSSSGPQERTRMIVFPGASLGWVEGGDGTVEGRDGADVGPQSSVPHSLDDLAQLGTIGLDNEVDREAVRGPRLRRSDHGHQCSSGPDQTRGPLPDIAADDIENQVAPADVFEDAVL